MFDGIIWLFLEGVRVMDQFIDHIFDPFHRSDSDSDSDSHSDDSDDGND